MKKLLIIIICALVTFGVTNAEDNYLHYRIPDDFDQYGPIATLDSEVTRIKYFKKGADTKDNNALIGVDHHRNGVLIKRDLYKDGVFHGLQMSWHPNGILKAEAPYKQGVMHGVFQHWDSQGQLIGKYEMSNGKGLRIIFFSNGVMNTFEEYDGNKGNGWFVGFHNNGEVDVVNKRKDDKYIFGFNAAFHDDGSIYFVTCADGELASTGILSYYSEKGENTDIKYYLAGEFVDKNRYLEASGKNKKSPFLLEDPQDYKKHLDVNVVKLANGFKNIEKVKIPLEFDDNGSIVTVSGKSLVLPK